MSDGKGGSAGRTGRSGTATAPSSVSESYREFELGSPEAAMYGSQMSEAWEKRLTPNERISVEHYKQSSTILNSALRAGQPVMSYLEPDLRGLDSSLGRARTTENLIVYRGLDPAASALVKPGMLFEDKGFMSTSLDKGIGNSFAQGGYVLRIKVKKGSRGMYIDGDPQKDRMNNAEREVLFARNSRLRIHSIDETTRRVEASLEQ